LVSICTAPGVKPTRNSKVRLSFGTHIFMKTTPF
jgi:hypothetical protein